MFCDPLTLVCLCSSAERPSRFTRWGTFHSSVFQLHISRSGLSGVQTQRHGGMLCVVWCGSVWTRWATVELSTGTNQHVSVSAGVELRHQGHLWRAADEAAVSSLTAPRRRDPQLQRENRHLSVDQPSGPSSGFMTRSESVWSLIFYLADCSEVLVEHLQKSVFKYLKFILSSRGRSVLISEIKKTWSKWFNPHRTTQVQKFWNICELRLSGSQTTGGAGDVQVSAPSDVIIDEAVLKAVTFYKITFVWLVDSVQNRVIIIVLTTNLINK